MRVIFNVDAISAPLTGIGRYALELARGLAIHPDIAQLRLYSAYHFVDDVEHALRANRAIAAVRRNIPLRGLALEAYALMRNGLFRLHTRGSAGHILHTPNYILLPFDGPSLTTVHDLSWLRFPQAHPRERVRFMDRHLPRSLEQASRVLTDSTFVADELVEHMALPRERIRVIPLGVDSSFRPRSDAQLRGALARHDLAPGAYTLVVATQEPRKNLERLARAWAGLPVTLQRRWPLVIVGARGWLNESLERTLAPLEARGQLRRLGYVSEVDLPLLYAGAHAFAFASLYEGFGLPVLEAMASGVPTLTSDCSSLPEVAGGAALLVDPVDEDALRAGLQRLLEDEVWREDARARGIAHARDYTWQACVQRTVAVYRELSGTE